MISLRSTVHGPQSSHRKSRSVWSASSLLALLQGQAWSKAGASSAHSRRFATFVPVCALSRNFCTAVG